MPASARSAVRPSPTDSGQLDEQLLAHLLHVQARLHGTDLGGAAAALGSAQLLAGRQCVPLGELEPRSFVDTAGQQLVKRRPGALLAVLCHGEVGAQAFGVGAQLGLAADEALRLRVELPRSPFVQVECQLGRATLVLHRLPAIELLRPHRGQAVPPRAKGGQSLCRLVFATRRYLRRARAVQCRDGGFCFGERCRRFVGRSLQALHLRDMPAVLALCGLRPALGRSLRLLGDAVLAPALVQLAPRRLPRRRGGVSLSGRRVGLGLGFRRRRLELLQLAGHVVALCPLVKERRAGRQADGADIADDLTGRCRHRPAGG
jgi:hypothetical protein